MKCYSVSEKRRKKKKRKKKQNNRDNVETLSPCGKLDALSTSETRGSLLSVMNSERSSLLVENFLESEYNLRRSEQERIKFVICKVHFRNGFA